MSVIACLRIPPTPAVCDLCAELTPVVEPAADCVWMDWTGGPPVPVLAARIAKAFNGDPDRLTYRLGVAPRRFAAGVLAAHDMTTEMIARIAARAKTTASTKTDVDAKTAVGAKAAMDAKIAAAGGDLFIQSIPGGYWVQEKSLPAFAARLPVALLPELEPAVRAALAALDVRTLGDLLTIPRELLQGHLGHETQRLLDWARGLDPHPVRALYPPERLVHRISAEFLAGANAQCLETALAQAATVLAERLQAAGQACSRLEIVWGAHRHERSFTPPIADAAQLARAAWQAARQMLAEWTRSRGRQTQALASEQAFSAPEQDFSLELPGDWVLEITPTGHQGRQTLLWEPERPSGARHHPALAAIRARFGHTFRQPLPLDGGAANFTGAAGQRARPGFPVAGYARKAVARYEAMNRFYRFPDRQ